MYLRGHAPTTGKHRQGTAVGMTFRKLLVALRIRYAGSATSSDARGEGSVMEALRVVITSPPIRFVTGPNHGTMPLVAETIAAFRIVGAISVRHVLGPRSGWTFIDDVPVEQRELVPIPEIVFVGGRQVEVGPV